MQGAAGQGVALTAFTIITFLQSPTPEQYAQNTDKAIQYIKSKVNASLSPYDLAICGYALALYNEPTKNDVLAWLNAQVKNSADFQYWENPSGAYSIEITGYGTLFRILMNDSNYAASAKYLVSKRNSLGSYGSTQDTVMSLKALTEYAKLLITPNFNLEITATSNENAPVQWTVNQGNALVVQKKDLAPETRRVDVSATGSGIALVQLECKFNVPFVDLPESFEVSATVEKPVAQAAYTLNVCARYKLSGVTNMALVDVHFLSGYAFDPDKKPAGPGLKVNPKTKFSMVSKFLNVELFSEI
jgi:CD109 antigen